MQNDIPYITTIIGDFTLSYKISLPLLSDRYKV